jgi:hypothetical protein
MRILLSTAALLASVLAAAPAQAQGGEFMWCFARAEIGAERAYFYSAFFPAEAWEADANATAFRREVEAREISDAAEIAAWCLAPASLDEATASRNAAMEALSGTVLDWEG